MRRWRTHAFGERAVPDGVDLDVPGGRVATVVFRRAIVRTGDRIKLRDVL